MDALKNIVQTVLVLLQLNLAPADLRFHILQLEDELQLKGLLEFARRDLLDVFGHESWPLVCRILHLTQMYQI